MRARRTAVAVLCGLLLQGAIGCSDTRKPSTDSSSGFDRPTADKAMRVVNELRGAGIPIGATAVRSPSDPAYEDRDGLIGKVDFRDTRLLSDDKDVEEDWNGGSVEVYRDTSAAIAALKDRCGYKLADRDVVVHLAGGMSPEWVIQYRDALSQAVSVSAAASSPPDEQLNPLKPSRRPARFPGC